MAIPLCCFGASRGKDLQVGVAFHAFDHLGGIGEQGETAAACGANIIYVTGIGALGYQGLPTEADLTRQRVHTSDYIRQAKRRGIRLAIGYICATSIVKLETFNKNWSSSFRQRFKTGPSDWRQVDRQGNVLNSWYGGDYQPACMNNPDWRAYEKFIVGQQLAAGCDGIFFDNPTVHPDGCYCVHCMRAFEGFLKAGTQPRRETLLPKDLAGMRDYAAAHSKEFLEFRCTIARDFLAEMKACARSIKKDALITANNSLNSPDVLFSQCRRYAYNIYEMSKTEDYVVVEDESSQPRTLPNGNTLEYGATYKQLTAISHGKPVVAVTIADGDYHTPPELVRLAMAEAAANDASYLAWPTWPESQRQRMINGIRPQAEFMRQNAGLFKSARARADVTVYLPFRNWLATPDCATSRFAAELTRANIQYEVVCEDGFAAVRTKILLADPRDLGNKEQRIVQKFTRSGGVLISANSAGNGTWLEEVKRGLTKPSLTLNDNKNVRAVVRDQSRRTLVHLLNLDIRKISSFEDKVTPTENLRLRVRVPRASVRSVRVLTADQQGTARELPFTTQTENGALLVETTVPRLGVAAILVIE